MTVRELLLGKTGGKTAWQHLRDRWARGRARERWTEELAKVWNPLGLAPGDLVEIGFADRKAYRVETVLGYRTPPGDPNYVRYGLSEIGAGQVRVLEVMPGQGEGERLLALFELVDEFALDRRLLRVLTDEDVLRQTVPDARGRAVEVDFGKDYETEASVDVFDAEGHSAVDVVSFNYFAQEGEGEGEGEEAYLSVEVLEQAEWMCFYRGHALQKSDVVALGSRAPVG